MVFWIAVLAGALFAWAAVQVGFYASWIMFFNLAFSAYVALFLAPVIVTTIPAATAATYGYGYGLVLMSIAIATLLLSYGICYAILSGDLRFELPKVLDNAGAGLLGFLAGFLVLSFVAFAVSLTPLTKIDVVKTLGFEAKAQPANTGYLYWWCDRLHGWVSSSRSQLRNSAQAGGMLLTRSGASDVGRPRTPAPPEFPAPLPAGQEGSLPADEAAQAVEPKPAATSQEAMPAPLEGPASEPPPSEGPLAGIWQAGSGPAFQIHDDGNTATVELIEPRSALQVFTGRLARVDGDPESKTLTGTVGVVVSTDPRREQQVVEVTVTIVDASNIRVQCPKWPARFQNQGKPAVAWTRAAGSSTTPPPP